VPLWKAGHTLNHYPAFRDYLESHYLRVQETREYLIYTLAERTAR